jgi:hypothetical protein
MHKLIAILACIIFLPIAMSSLVAQEITKPFEFPHKSGDMWEYLYTEFGTPNKETVQVLTVSDSMDSQGVIYVTQHAKRINPIGSPIFFLDTMNFAIDSIDVYGPYFQNYEYRLVYKLNAKQGDQWVVEGDSGYYEIARIEEKWEGSLFGRQTTFMGVMYYLASDSIDTTGLGRYYDEIADGFGLVSRVSAEYIGEVRLIGAIIDGDIYGHISPVSVNRWGTSLPSSVSLEQNYPNPFNPSTTISFELPENSIVSIIIYDILGKEIYRLINIREYQAGVHSVVWNGLREDGNQVASGTYIYRLITNKQVISRMMIFLQ